MSESLSSFASLFRAVLLLHGIESPVGKHKIVALTAQHLQINGAPFERIFNIRENNYAQTLDDVSANQLFADYMREIENVIAAVDNLKTS